ncbi:MAG TPA: GTPase ObgE [Candidatus Saccharimonadales bacterium]|nr:GTPase ObgE [Candidatus Saccharimonadales bacterium]
MFVDKVQVTIQAGKGGDGKVSFRHEKFVDRGGPDGGDGGKGGDVILSASRNQNTLAKFRYKKLLKAENGNAGDKVRRHGRNGQNLVVPVPVGTVVIDGAGKMVADLSEDGQEIVIAAGGQGGFGNAHFVSSRRQAPRVAEKGEIGDQLEATLELKIIADVGIVGLPNAGKSTLLSVISHAHPEIADYPFTTLVPNLGVVDIDKSTSLLFADIPGLIEGASHGKGLGDEFLRHIERTKVLIHLIDAYEDVKQAYKTVQNELKAYKTNLSLRPQLIVLNKTEGLSKKEINILAKELKKLLPARTSVYDISAASREGVDQLLYKIKAIVAKTKVRQSKIAKPKLPILRLPKSDDTWKVAKRGNRFVISGKKIERFAQRTDFDNPESVERLRDIMKKMGIAHELIRQGIKVNNVIVVGAHKLKW